RPKRTRRCCRRDRSGRDRLRQLGAYSACCWQKQPWTCDARQRWREELSGGCSSRLGTPLADVIDRLLDGGNFLGVLIWNLDLDPLLQRHDQLDSVERIRAQVVDERSSTGDLLCLHP